MLSHKETYARNSITVLKLKFCLLVYSSFVVVSKRFEKLSRTRFIVVDSNSDEIWSNRSRGRLNNYKRRCQTVTKLGEKKRS
jgi:hypothetical protein